MDASSTWESPQIMAALLALSSGGKRHVSAIHKFHSIARNRAEGPRSCKTTSAQPTLIKMARGSQWLYVTLLINKHYAPAVPMKRARGRLNYVMLSKWWSSGPNICDVYIVRILTQATRLPFDAAGPSSAAVCRWKAEL